jgi:hypothetical protein
LFACYFSLLKLSIFYSPVLFSSCVCVCLFFACTSLLFSLFYSFFSFIIIIIIIILFVFLFYFLFNFSPLGLGSLPPFLAPYKSINSSDTCSQYKLKLKNKF